MIKLGTVVMTQGIGDFCKKDESAIGAIREAIARHQNRDWGEISEDDKALNDEVADLEDARVMSAYTISGTKIWIFTESTQETESGKLTTLLLPEEY